MQSLTSGTTKVEFAYDYMGRRVEKKVFSYVAGNCQLMTDNYFLYDGWNMICESSVVGQQSSVKSYIYGLDLSQTLQGAGGIGGLITSVDTSTNKMYYYLYDANGNVTQLIDSTDGSLTAHYEYDPYGNITVKSGSYVDVNPYRFSSKYFDQETGLGYWGYRYYSPVLGRWSNRDPIEELGHITLRELPTVTTWLLEQYYNIELGFPGQYQDQETGLHHNFNRYYDPRTGRYLTPDPIGQRGGLNLYEYVGNNPVNVLDPEGLFSIKGDCCNRNEISDSVQSYCNILDVIITDTKLRKCLHKRCESAAIICGGEFCGNNVAGYDEHRIKDYIFFKRTVHEKSIHLCVEHPGFKKDKTLYGRLAIHEWAESCGWNHGDGKGVPGDDGNFNPIKHNY